MIAFRMAGLSGTLAIGTLLACGEITSGPPPGVLTSLELTPASLRIAPLPGLDNDRIDVRGRNQFGGAVLVERGSFSITSSDPGVVAVSQVTALASDLNGLYYEAISARVTAVATGEAVISASWTVRGVTKTATATVLVESLEGWSLKVTPPLLTVHVGSSERVEAAVLDAVGRPRLTSAEYIGFGSDGSDVVALDLDAWCWAWPCAAHVNILGVTPGEAAITARSGSLSASTRVIVLP